MANWEQLALSCVVSLSQVIWVFELCEEYKHDSTALWNNENCVTSEDSLTCFTNWGHFKHSPFCANFISSKRLAIMSLSARSFTRDKSISFHSSNCHDWHTDHNWSRAFWYSSPPLNISGIIPLKTVCVTHLNKSIFYHDFKYNKWRGV